MVSYFSHFVTLIDPSVHSLQAVLLFIASRFVKFYVIKTALEFQVLLWYSFSKSQVYVEIKSVVSFLGNYI